MKFPQEENLESHKVDYQFPGSREAGGMFYVISTRHRASFGGDKNVLKLTMANGYVKAT